MERRGKMIDQLTKDALKQHITQTLWKRAEVEVNPLEHIYNEGYNSALTAVQNIIESLPCEKEGAWTGSKHKTPSKIFTCSECKGDVVLPVFAERCYYDFCPNCGAKMNYETVDNSTDLQKNIDIIKTYEGLQEKFKPYLSNGFGDSYITSVTWNEDKREFTVYYDETFCGCTDSCSESFPANIFDMTPEEYKEILEKKKQEEKRLRDLEREQNERNLLAKLKKKYESEEVKDIFREAEGILLNEENK